MPSRAADASGPFGDADLWIGAGRPASGLQRSIGAGDLPGPLWARRGTSGNRSWYRQSWARIFDRCWELDEHGNVAGGDYHSLEYVFGERADRKYRPACPDTSRSDSRFSVHFRGPWSDNESDAFPTREQAQVWVDERWAEAERAERESTGLPRNVDGFGFVNSLGLGQGEPFGIGFAPVDAPVDEVRVLSGTVAVSGGVLRGLVRNWSRRLWAYGVTVAAGEHVFEWPLSVQPGEVAPFEIGGWDGPTDAGLIDIDVTAELSWHADPSRAWELASGYPRVLRVGELTRRGLPDSVRDRYVHVTGDVAAGSVSLGSVEVLSVPLRGATSHLSLRDVYDDFAVADLRGYGALFDSHGRVVDVGPAPTVGVTSYDGRGVAERFEEVTRLPHPLAEPRHGSPIAAFVAVLFDIHADLARDGYEFGEPGGTYWDTVRFDDEFVVIGDRRFPREGTLHGGFILWTGAAHPQLDDGVQ